MVWPCDDAVVAADTALWKASNATRLDSAVDAGCRSAATATRTT